MDHCEMSARGRGMPPQSRGVTCIYSPDVAVHRLCPRELPTHLDQLPASRVLAEAAQPVPSRRIALAATRHHLPGTLQHMCGVCRALGTSQRPWHSAGKSTNKLALTAFLRKQTICKPFVPRGIRIDLVYLVLRPNLTTPLFCYLDFSFLH